MLGIRELLSEIVVIGHDQQAAGIEVEAAHWREPRFGLPDQLVHSRTPFRIAPRSRIPLRLIQQQVRVRGVAERCAVQCSAVTIQLHPVVGILKYPTEYQYLTHSDPRT